MIRPPGVPGERVTLQFLGLQWEGFKGLKVFRSRPNEDWKPPCWIVVLRGDFLLTSRSLWCVLCTYTHISLKSKQHVTAFLKHPERSRTIDHDASNRGNFSWSAVVGRVFEDPEALGRKRGGAELVSRSCKWSRRMLDTWGWSPWSSVLSSSAHYHNIPQPYPSPSSLCPHILV